MRAYPKRIIRFLFIVLIVSCIIIFISFSRFDAPGIQEIIEANGPVEKSYENLTFRLSEQQRIGYGENGLPVVLRHYEEVISRQYKNQNGFNTYVSDKIKIDRSVKDIRNPKCRDMQYQKSLPNVSVIIPFFEEHLKTLIRTFVSVLNRSQSHLIHEIILVDDGSKRSYLRKDLDDYILQNHPDGKVRVLRLPERRGLILAKLKGAEQASGEVLLFLDSHCEANLNWLPPLLDPIASDYRTVVCPFIDVIKADTFEYTAQDEGARGAFDWEFYYKRLPLLPESIKNPEKPFDNPIMAGGLFAISKKWFMELGGYDPGLLIWGAEQYELSFKIWMCGGRMIDVPCSRVGHIYRKYSTDFPRPNLGDFVSRNYKRVAEVWMDEYKEYLYKRLPRTRDADPGDLSERKALRKKLNCKSFKWFMENIAFDLVKKYPPVIPVGKAIGEIRSNVDRSVCIEAADASESVPVRLTKCYSDHSLHNGDQKFEYTYKNEIRSSSRSKCFDVSDHKSYGKVYFYNCHLGGGNQFWELRPINNDNKNPIQLIHSSHKCLDADHRKRVIYINECNPNLITQQWYWETLQIEKAENDKAALGL